MHVTRNQISVDSVPELTPGPSRKHLPRGADPGLEGIARGDGDGLVRRDHDHLVDGIWIRPVPLAALEDGGRTRVGGVLLQDAESQEHRLVLFVDTEDPAEDEVVEEYSDYEREEAEEEDAQHPRQALQARPLRRDAILGFVFRFHCVPPWERVLYFSPEICSSAFGASRLKGAVVVSRMRVSFSPRAVLRASRFLRKLASSGFCAKTL